MNDRQKAAFESVRDAVKQFITLATALVALTITFSKDFAENSSAVKPWAMASWSTLLLSVVFGLWALLALTGTLEPIAADRTKETLSIRGSNITIPVTLQVISFLVGLLLMVVFGVKAI